MPIFVRREISSRESDRRVRAKASSRPGVFVAGESFGRRSVAPILIDVRCTTSAKGSLTAFCCDFTTC